MRLKPPKFLRCLMPGSVWNIPTREPEEVFLTFDDGPTPGITEWILEELARHDAKATFFCLGRNVETYPELAAKILAGGHRIGNHTYGHTKGWGTDAVSYAADVEHAAEFIDSGLFRPPYGRISPRKTKLLSARYRIVMWNLISRDYSRRLSPQGCLDNVIKHVRSGDIVVFHDSRKAFDNMSYALPRVLEYLDARGMKSKAIEL